MRVSVREIGDAEVAFYQEHGWVKLDGLVDPDLVSQMRITAQKRLVESEESKGAALVHDGSLAIGGHEPFRSVAFSERMGRSAQRLINRARLTGVDVPVRFKWDVLIGKFRDQGATSYHQDSPHHGCDRTGELMFWIALAEVTPEMGAMRFLTGSHREGWLGVQRDGDLFDHYPRLLDLYEFSDPFHYQPGDATVHHGCMIHGAPPNTTDRQRLSYIVAYAPADTHYFIDSEGSVLSGGDGLTLPPEDRYPIVYG